jgi:cobaltochelatase CobS
MHCIHLRHPNNGNPKDWGVIVQSDSIDIYFGLTSRIKGPPTFGNFNGLTSKSVHTPRPSKEASDRAQSKLDKGYRHVPEDDKPVAQQVMPEPEPSQLVFDQTTNLFNGDTIMEAEPDVPTVQSLFHPSFPPVPWPVRERHVWQAFVPEPSHYLFRPEITADFLGWIQTNGRSCLLTGPTGCGKSSLVVEIAARSNVPVFPVVGHNRLEFIDLAGQYVPDIKGGFIYEYGPLPMAMQSGGIFLFDEIDLVDPSTLVALNSVLDGRPLVLSANGGEVVEPMEGFRFIATANTTGHGDGEAYGYSGTLKMSKAFLNRLQWTFVLDYPQMETEVSIVEALIGTTDIAEKMVRLAHEIRQMHTADDSPLADTMSTRELIEWAKAAMFFRKIKRVRNPIGHGLKYAVVNRASKEGRPMFAEIYQRIFNQEL